MLERKKTLNVFRDARAAFGSYDDFPVGPPGTDPMPHLSRNRVAQPFWQTSARDQVVIHMAGEARLRFRDGEPDMELGPGDCVYVPAGAWTKLEPRGECVQVKLKVEPAVAERVAWFCEPCGRAVREIAIEDPVFQRGYLAAVEAFNASDRACPACGAQHPIAALGDIAWDRVVAALG